MKIVLKLFYIIFVIFLISTIELSGGIHGLKMVTYTSSNLHNNPDDLDYTLSILSGVLDIYIDKESEPLVIPVKSEAEGLDFTVTFVPFGSPKNIRYSKEVSGTTQYLESLFDGFIIKVTASQLPEDLKTIDLTFTSSNPTDLVDNYFVTKISIQVENLGAEIMPQGYGLLSYGQDILGNHVTSVYGEDVKVSQIDFTKFGNYNLNSLQITSPTVDKPIYYGWEDGTRANELAKDTALIADDQLVIDEDLMLISRRLFGQDGFRNPSTAELLDNPNLVYTIPNLAPYNYWAWIIVGLYVVVILVIPYFWMFRKPIKRMIANKKEQKEREALIASKKQSSQPQYKTLQQGKAISKEKKDENDK